MTKTDDITKVNKSTSSKYAPTVNIIPTKPAEIADSAISLLFIIYSTYYKAYPYNTKLRRKTNSFLHRYHPSVDCFVVLD